MLREKIDPKSENDDLSAYARQFERVVKRIEGDLDPIVLVLVARLNLARPRTSEDLRAGPRRRSGCPQAPAGEGR